MNRIQTPDALVAQYEPSPPPSQMCPLSQVLQTPVPGETSTHSTTYMSSGPVGPTTLKRLYPSREGSSPSHRYPPQTIVRPVDTLYGHDYSQYHTSGVGRGKRMSYHFKAYPNTDLNVKEYRHYSNFMIATPDVRNRTVYPVSRTNSVNSELQSAPNARW